MLHNSNELPLPVCVSLMAALPSLAVVDTIPCLSSVVGLGWSSVLFRSIESPVPSLGTNENALALIAGWGIRVARTSRLASGDDDTP